MKPPEIDHYATLGLDRRCTVSQIRSAYRILAKQHHPDVNPNSQEAVSRTQELNAAYETLSDPAQRRAHDLELDGGKRPTGTAKVQRNISLDVNLRIQDFLNGATREIRVDDPANPHGPELFQLVIPPDTAPGARFRLPRSEPFSGGFVQVRVRAMPDFRFKARGSDLRCDLKIKPERASQGGTEMIRGVTGKMLCVQIPRSVGRGEILRIPNEGLPKPRGGRGDLLVRVTYRVDVRVSRRN